MRILGIDPGYAILGWAVIEHDFSAVAYGAIEPPARLPVEERLLMIHTGLASIIAQYRPEAAAIERLFFSKNTKTALDVAKGMGVVMMTLAQAGIGIDWYAPVQVKTAVTGYGRATKQQIQHMTMKIFRISEIPRPDDAADAMAIAACHSLCRGSSIKTR